MAQSLQRIKDFQHAPLDQTKQEIRVLSLNPGLWFERLSGNIQVLNLEDDSVDYETVSYTWADDTGDSSLNYRIYITPNEGVMRISNTCDRVLRVMRSSMQKRMVWIDMVCIDQTNVLERNHQVAQMKTVYSRSSCVNIDIGDDKLGKEVFYYLKKHPMEFENRYGRLEPSAAAFTALFSRRWFHRVWVLQEVALAQKAEIYCGSISIPWSSLYRHTDGYIHENSMSASLSRSTVDKIRPPACRIYGMFRNDTVYTLVDLLVASRQCQCSDQRDKIYALFGLLDTSQIPFEPDYSKPYRQIYTDVAIWDIKLSRSLRILNYIQPLENLLLPSWVPDWTRTEYKPWAVLPDSVIARRVHSNWAGLPDVRVSSQGRDTLTWLSNPDFQPGNPWSTQSEEDSYNQNEPVRFEFSTAVTMNIPSSYPSEMPTLVVTASQLATIRVDAEVNCNSLADIQQGKGTGYVMENEFGDAVRNGFWSLIPSFTAFQNLPIPTIFRSAIRLALNTPIRYKNAPTLDGLSLKYEMDDVDEFSPVKQLLRQKSFMGENMGEPGLVNAVWGLFSNDAVWDRFIRDAALYHGQLKGFVTEYSLGFGPETILNGDMIWILDGINKLYVLRQEGTKYRIIGPCYLLEDKTEAIDLVRSEIEII